MRTVLCSRPSGSLSMFYALCFGVCACCPLYVREYLSCLCMLAPLVVLPLTIPMPYIHSITQTLLGPDQSLHQAGASNHLHLHFTHLRAALNLFTTTAVRTRDPIVNSGFHHSSAYITGAIHHHYHYIHGLSGSRCDRARQDTVGAPSRCYELHQEESG